jgi:hypothetical protein
MYVICELRGLAGRCAKYAKWAACNLWKSADIEKMLTPKGCVEARKGLEGCGAATAQPGPERTAEPRKARFFAEQKMRPNEAASIR